MGDDAGVNTPVSDPIDLESPDLATLEELAERLPLFNGRPISRQTLWSWCIQGRDGVRLNHVRLGRRILTTMGEVNRFARRLADRHLPAQGQEVVP